MLLKRSREVKVPTWPSKKRNYVRTGRLKSWGVLTILSWARETREERGKELLIEMWLHSGWGLEAKTKWSWTPKSMVFQPVHACMLKQWVSVWWGLEITCRSPWPMSLSIICVLSRNALAMSVPSLGAFPGLPGRRMADRRRCSLPTGLAGASRWWERCLGFWAAHIFRVLHFPAWWKNPSEPRSVLRPVLVQSRSRPGTVLLRASPGCWERSLSLKPRVSSREFASGPLLSLSPILWMDQSLHAFMIMYLNRNTFVSEGLRGGEWGVGRAGLSRWAGVASAALPLGQCLALLIREQCGWASNHGQSLFLSSDAWEQREL